MRVAAAMADKPMQRAARLSKNMDIAKITEAIRLAGAQEVLHNCRDSLDCVLNRSLSEDGMQLSGGQWQKLAMVRALLRPAKVRILDEPTASLDPKMESEIYRLFQEMTKDTLTILVSHRLGFARLADEIIVFENGKIREQGGFQRLMQKKGLFYAMYEEQRSWYQ